MRYVERHYGMDRLRIAAFALLIFYHVGMYFVPWYYHVKPVVTYRWVELPMLASNGWRLALLFTVSGFASSALFAKAGGIGAFLRSRFKRLVLPVLFGAVFIIPPQPWVEMVTKHGYTHGFLYFWRHDYFRFGVMNGVILPTYQHLWFVVYLWHYTLVVALLALLPSGLLQGIRTTANKALEGPLVLIVPTLWLALVYLVLLPGEDFTYALINDVVAHAIYFPGFLFGWLLAGNEVLWGAVRRWWRLAAGVAICAIAALLNLEALSLTGQIEWTAETERLFEGLRALQGWPAILGLIGLFDRFANRNHRWRAPLNEAVFPAYIAHQTIIILGGWLLLRTDIAGWPAFALLVVATVAGSAGFCLLGRIGWLRLFIGFGARRRKTQDVAEAAPSAAA